MSDTAKKAPPKRVGPFQGVNPPEGVGAPPTPPPKPPANDMKMSEETIRKLEEERKLDELRDTSGKAAEISRRASMNPLKKAKGGMVSSASKRADGCAVKGKTRGKFV